MSHVHFLLFDFFDVSLYFISIPAREFLSVEARRAEILGSRAPVVEASHAKRFVSFQTQTKHQA